MGTKGNNHIQNKRDSFEMNTCGHCSLLSVKAALAAIQKDGIGILFLFLVHLSFLKEK